MSHCFRLMYVVIMAIRVVEFSSGGYKIEKNFSGFNWPLLQTKTNQNLNYEAFINVTSYFWYHATFYQDVFALEIVRHLVKLIRFKNSTPTSKMIWILVSKTPSLQNSFLKVIKKDCVIWHVMTTANTCHRCRPRRACMQCRPFVFVFKLLSLPTGKTLSSTNFHFLSLFWPLKAILSLF